jgi:hypothetical protein
METGRIACPSDGKSISSFLSFLNTFVKKMHPVNQYVIIIATRLLYFISAAFLSPDGETEKYGLLYHSACGIMV